MPDSNKKDDFQAPEYFPSLELGDPNYSPDGAPQPISSEVDFTNATNDISRTARTTLGMYLTSKTAGNNYSITKVTQLTGDVNARGKLLAPAESNDQEVFAKKDSPGLPQTGLGVPISGKGPTAKPQNKGLSTFFTDKQIKEVLDKTGGDQAKSGHLLLSSVPAENYQGTPPENATSTGEKILHSIYVELKNANMYNPYDIDSAFIKNGGAGNASTLDDEAAASRGLFTVQRNLGSFDKNQEPVTTSDLSSRVLSMLASSPSAQSPYRSPDPTMIDLLDPEQVSELSSQYPWKLQQGMKSPPLQDWNSARIFSADSFSGQSLPRAQAAGFLDLVSQCYLQLLSAANNIKANIQFIKKNRFVSLNDKQATLTSYTLNDSPDTSLLTYGQRESRRYWDIKSRELAGAKDPAIDYTFEKSFFRGVSLFFGLETNDNAIPSVALLAQSPIFSDSSGYYMSVFRSLTASPPFEGRGKSSTNLTKDLQSTGSDKRSKIYKFVMVLVALGDVSFKSQVGMRDVTPSERMLTKEASRYISPSLLALTTVAAANLDAPKIWATAAGGALLGKFRPHVSRWSAIGAYDAAPSANPLSLHTFYAATKTPPGAGAGSTTPIGMRGMKPSRENVELIENAIESEYMPFYMHDLRTHEIMSMPAFITAFSETFTAQYGSAQGFGRQDPVRTYQSTERAVTFSFILASFNEEDFDHMWLLVNKLVSMCYPQYSAGRVRTSGDKSFIQPFSQVPAASPMIRLRLGDVFKSNYSKFGLARLFGANSTAILKKQDDPVGVTNKAVQAAAEGVSAVKSAASTLKNAAILTAAKAAGNVLNVANAKTDTAGSFAANTLYDEGSTSQRVTNYVSNDQANDIRTAVKIGTDAIIGEVNSPNTIPTNLYPETSFFDKTQNSVVRSFETTRGRGVAGFITSLGLDYEGATWETKFGKKAPKMVKITLGFAPITDLPLGLDYDGYMRNPSHPAGRFAGSYGDVYDDIQSGINGNIAAKDFNKSTISRKISSGQVAADVALSAAFAVDDVVTNKP